MGRNGDEELSFLIGLEHTPDVMCFDLWLQHVQFFFLNFAKLMRLTYIPRHKTKRSVRLYIQLPVKSAP